MPDTSAARKAVQAAYARRRDVMGGMSMAELKLQAAGFFRNDDPPPAYSEDDPVWIEHALIGLWAAEKACDALKDAITVAIAETEKLRPSQVPSASLSMASPGVKAGDGDSGPEPGQSEQPISSAGSRTSAPKTV